MSLISRLFPQPQFETAREKNKPCSACNQPMTDFGDEDAYSWVCENPDCPASPCHAYPIQ